MVLALGCWALCLLAACTASKESQLEEVRELQATNEMEKSIPILIDLIESGDRGGEILYRYGRALSLTGKPERSIWALDAAREDKQWFVSASQQLALDAHRGGNLEFALEVFERLHEEAPDEGEEDPFALLLEARVLLETQTHFEEALELLDSILERFPEEEGAIRMKAVALLGLKRSDEAYEIIRTAGLGPSDAATGDEALGGEAAGKGAGEKDAAEAGEDPELYLEVEDEKREAYWCMIHVSFKREAGELEEATKIVDDCLERFPTSTGLLSEAVEHFAGLGRTDRVLEILKKAYEKEPHSAQIRDAYTQYLSSMGRYKDVEKVLRKGIEEVTKTQGESLEVASLWVELAGFLMDHERVGEALVAFDSANKIIGDGITPDLLLREAEAMIRAKEYDEALAMADKTPVEVHADMIRGRVLFERGEYQASFDELQKAATLWPDNAPIRYYRARAAEGLGKFDVAIEEYRQAVRSDADLDAARERLARLHLAEGNVRDASAILTFISPKKASTPSTAMRILMVEVDTIRGTEPDLNISSSPEYPADRVRTEAIDALSRGLSQRTSPKVAEAFLKEFEKTAVPEIRGPFVRERVELLMSLGRTDEALTEARTFLKARPGDLDGKIALARVLVRENDDLAEAQRLLDGVIAEKPTEVEALTTLADLAVVQKDLARADAGYDRVLAVAPDHWPALSPRVQHLVASGKRDEAISRLETFVDRDSPYEGRAALELARLLPESEKSHDRRIALARRAIRFGAGQPAVDLLVSLDPAAADEFEPSIPPVPVEAGSKAGGATEGAPKEKAKAKAEVESSGESSPAKPGAA